MICLSPHRNHVWPVQGQILGVDGLVLNVKGITLGVFDTSTFLADLNVVSLLLALSMTHGAPAARLSQVHPIQGLVCMLLTVPTLPAALCPKQADAGLLRCRGLPDAIMYHLRHVSLDKHMSSQNHAHPLQTPDFTAPCLMSDTTHGGAGWHHPLWGLCSGRSEAHRAGL